MMQVIDQLLIPVAESEEVVAVPLSQLPEEPEELLDILASEAAPLATWFDFARAYLAQNKVDKYVYICTEGVREDVASEVEKFFGQKPTYEQIQFYCGMAALSMARAKEEKDKQKRSDHLTTASKYLTQAKGLEPKEQLVSLGYGLLASAKGDMHTARQEFSKAIPQLNNGRPNILGYLAVAAIHFNQKQYKEALALYRRALREHPECPAEVRLGIAACQFRLGELNAADLAYARVLELDPDCSEALLGQAVIKFNSGNVQQGLADGLKLLVRAYELDPTNVSILSLLAHYCLLRGDAEKVVVLARAALESADTDALRADCLTLLGRGYHALGQWSEAMAHYAQATRLDPSLPLPHYGVAQMYLHDAGEHMNAASELEAALKVAPQFYDALKILGRLYPLNPTKVENTIVHFRNAAAKQDSDAEIWEMFGELLSPSDPAGSISAYKKALALHEQKQAATAAERAAAVERGRRKPAKANGVGEEDDLFGGDSEEEEAPPEAAGPLPEVHSVPTRLLNNAAVLFYRSGDKAKAKSLLEAATAALASDPSSSMHKVTVDYNLARVQEACGDYKSAVAGYKAIKEECPGYVDCYLRLACMECARGAIANAVSWAEQVPSVQGLHADRLALLSQLYMEQGELEKARVEIVKLVSDPASKHDTYGRLAFGNLYLAQAQELKRKPENMSRINERLSKALGLFRPVLEKDPHNVFAANAIGVVLAEQGHYEEAADIFSMVQEAAVSSGAFLQLPDVWVNLGNIHLARKEYVSAIRTYQAALTKFYNNQNGQVLLYLARAYYDSKELPQAKRCLLRALHVAPTDYRLRFNIAVAMQNWGVHTVGRKRPENDAHKLEDFRKARGELQLARKTFQHLCNLDHAVTGLDTGKLRTHLEFCTAKDQEVKVYVERAENELKLLNAKRREQEAQLALAAERRRRDELTAQLAQEALLKHREKLATEAFARSGTVLERWRINRAEIGDGGDEPEARPARKEKKRKRQKDKGRGAEEEEEEEAEPEAEYVEGGDEPRGSEEEGAVPEEEDELAEPRGAGYGEENGDEDVDELFDDVGDAPANGAGGGRLVKRSRIVDDDDEDDEGGGVRAEREEAMETALEDPEDEEM